MKILRLMFGISLTDMSVGHIADWSSTCASRVRACQLFTPSLCLSYIPSASMSYTSATALKHQAETTDMKIICDNHTFICSIFHYGFSVYICRISHRHDCIFLKKNKKNKLRAL